MSSHANSTIPKMIKHTKLLSETPQNLPKSFNKTKHKTHFTFKKQNFNTNKTKKHYQKTLNSKILHYTSNKTATREPKTINPCRKNITIYQTNKNPDTKT
jgi:cytochrome c biogenesis protein ResB